MENDVRRQSALDRKKRIRDAVEEIELCVWEHLFIGSDPMATLDLLKEIGRRIDALYKEIEDNT